MPRTAYLLKCLRRKLVQANAVDRRRPSDFSKAADDIVWLVRFYYLFVLFSVARNPTFGIMRDTPTDPLWPVSLLMYLTGGSGWITKATLTMISIAGSTAALLAVVFPGMLILRLCVFLHLFFGAALLFSDSFINHGFHFSIFIGFALLFLPSTVGRPRRMPRKDAMNCIMVFWFVQSVILLSYSLAGFWKVWVSNWELLAPDGMIRVLLARLMENEAPAPPLLPLLALHDRLLQLTLLGAVYLQFFAVFALFRPHLHRPWGIGLILFHFGSDWLIGVTFAYNIAFLGLFFIFSPFAPASFSLTGLARSLPLLGIPFRLWIGSGRPVRGAERAWLVYDGECPFCSRYAHYLDVGKAIGELVLVNAREGGPLVREIRDLPYDLNDGMALKLHGRYYFGGDALHVLALLSGNQGFFNAANRLLFRLPVAARLGYPLLKLGRRLALKLKGAPPIEN